MGICGEKHHLDFHLLHHMLHFHHHHHHGKKDGVRRGCFAVMVGQGEEELERFVVPVIYMNHPLFVELLKEAEEEYGFDQKGPITIPCHVQDFRNLQGLIHKDHHHHHVWCFGV